MKTLQIIKKNRNLINIYVKNPEYNVLQVINGGVVLILVSCCVLYM